MRFHLQATARAIRTRQAASIRRCGVRADSPTMTRALLATLLCAGLTFSAAAGVDQAAGTALRVVRAGYGNVPAMKEGLARSVEACQIIKHMPPVAATLPSDAQLAQLKIIEQEELFDGARWASYEVQRQVGADPANGCQLALFSHRVVTVEKSCESRISAVSAPLGELMAMEGQTTTAPAVTASVLSPSACRRKPRVTALEGLPRQEAGGARCVWSSAIMSRQLAALQGAAGGTDAGSEASPPAGFDTCLYEARPVYTFGGLQRPVVLMTRTPPAPGGLANLSRLIGEMVAFFNLKLLSVTTLPSIPDSRFSRSSIDLFIHQPTKGPVETN